MPYFRYVPSDEFTPESRINWLTLGKVEKWTHEKEGKVDRLSLYLEGNHKVYIYIVTGQLSYSLQSKSGSSFREKPLTSNNCGHDQRMQHYGNGRTGKADYFYAQDRGMWQFRESNMASYRCYPYCSVWHY